MLVSLIRNLKLKKLEINLVSKKKLIDSNIEDFIHLKWTNEIVLYTKSS
jgi:hypothetical protein